jgi:hypothetical protein
MSDEALQEALDNRLQDALDFSNYRITLYNQKQLLKQKLDEQLTISINGGIIKVSQELISFIGYIISMGKNDVILLDINKNPIFIDDLNAFHKDIIAKYYQSMNDYLVEFKNMQKARNVKSLAVS